MPNQLSIPFKRTYVIPIREAVRQYILSHYTDTHPDAYKWDIGQWEKLRAEAISSVVHIDRVNALISYHAQLVFILTKLPHDIGLEIPYAPIFNSDAVPEPFNNLVYERAGILFNLAALYSQLGAAEDRSAPQGLKQAIKCYQNAAGALNYLNAFVIPQLRATVAPEEAPLEFTEPIIRGLEFLVLAQAQECVWQRAVMDNYKNGLIAKLAAKVSSLYGTAAAHIKNPSVRHVFPLPWIAQVETKTLHFQAAAQYRKSLEDLEAHKYGYEISRLTEARDLAKRGHDVARRGGAAPPVQQDIKSLLDIVQKNISRAERDNDLIYHQDVPPSSALPVIQEVSMVQPLTDPGLQDPKIVVGTNGVIFGELLGWGARLAIEIYNDRRQNWIAEEVTGRAQRLDDESRSVLESLNLPAALEALDRPIGLPPSLLKKAEEVRLERGPERIEASIRDVRTLANHDSTLLDEAMDILDQEADEDEAFREAHPTAERLPSYEANKDIIEKEQRYRTVLQQARDSDELVRQKWEDWEENIGQLTWSESELESSIPSSTASHAWQSPADTTRSHARALRMLLEMLDDLSKSREEIAARTGRLSDSDDIRPRILKAASGMEQWVNVQPAMFEDILDEELAKYDKFRRQLEEDGKKQADLLTAIKERHAEFTRSRKEDAPVKERELALQSLDLAYGKYKEIVRNLDEGLKFYNDLAVILSQFRDACKEFVNLRRTEIRCVATSDETSSTSPAIRRSASETVPSDQHNPPESPTSPRRHPGHRVRPALDLPPPDSDEWETMELPPAPKPATGRRVVPGR
ncbi:pH-response regulator [Dichomitus squalens LYAD-421 SS1]|uniref:pH-response regulator n=1 Tax=Dichomitus squalens (strain LYAD-421) TaxID=732165 RepID=UPI0004410D47|nr:pH-response regulator [Dichomitus squalens LYAD-421 SS1]EJF64930.1 pH-response regulator [Dichomitus squalens LYAD-421 SS1]